MTPSRVLDRFVLGERLGGGGFGTVYRAFDERLEREVAVKLVTLAGSSARERAEREARAAARLSHPGIVSLFELGFEGREAILVSELVEGQTLARLRDDDALSDRDVAAIGAELCAALAHAHSRGVVHRDLKPQNVLVAEGSGRAKLTDFGIARVVGANSLTATGDVLGTIAYMAPEQAGGEKAGPEADVFSLALTLFELWAGAHPLAECPAATTVRRLERADLPSLGDVRPDLPVSVRSAIDAALAEDPAARPGAGELCDALSAALPALSDAGGLRPLPPVERVARALSLGAGPRAARAGSALLLAVTCTAALAWIGGGAPSWAAVTPIAAAVAWLLVPRIAFAATAILLAGVALSAGRSGIALAICLAGVAPALIAPGARRSWPLLAIAPALGWAGLAAAFPAIAGLGRTAASRTGIALCGYGWLVGAEALSGHSLLLGPGQQPRPGWEHDAGRTLDAIAANLTAPVLLGGLVYAGAALVLPVLLRGRTASLDALGAVIWGAGLVALLEAASHAGDGVSSPTRAVLVGTLALGLVPAALIRRAHVASPPRGLSAAAAGSVPDTAYD